MITRTFSFPVLLLLTLMCLVCGFPVVKAQECEVVAHVVESGSGDESLVLLPSGTSTRYTQLAEVEGDKGFFYGKKYYVSIECSEQGEWVCRYYNVGKWLLVATYRQDKMPSKLLSVLYNPLDDVLYCVVQDMVTRAYRLQKMSVTDNGLIAEEAEPLTLQRPFYALFATAEGNLYGFATDAGLYQIDCVDGGCTKLFSTTSVGMETQSSWVDAEGIIYRAVPSSIGTSIYSYNLSEEREKFVKVFTTASSIVAMAANDFPIDNSKPMPVANLMVQWGDNHNRGTISFTAPGEDINGIELTDSLTIQVAVDDVMIDTLQVLPLAECSINYEFADGKHVISAVVTNEYGDSQEASCAIYAGYDVPRPIERIGIEKDFPYVEVWWSVPSGEHGEVVDVANLRYRVVRYPDGVLVADTEALGVRDSLPAMPFFYQYGVVAYLPDYETAETRSTSFFYDCTMQPPFSFTYWDYNIFSAFKLDDANGDGVTWDYFRNSDGEMELRYKYSSVNAADDYLYFPVMHLQEKVYYEATVYMHAGSEKYSESFSMGIVPDEDVDKRVELLSRVVVESKSSTPYNKGFVVEKSGDYRLYLHCNSGANRHILYVDSVKITTQNITTQPQPVSNVELHTDELYPCHVTIECQAPTMSVDGTLLDELDEVVIYRNEEVVYTHVSPTPGATITYCDSVGGIDNYTYSIIATNSSGNSVAVVKDIVRGVAAFPFEQDFTDGVGFFTTIDHNNDGVTWHFYEERFMGCMRYLSSEVQAADDWLLTPPVYLSDSIRYQVEYDCYAGHSHYPESMRVILGRTPIPNAMSMVIDELVDFTVVSPQRSIVVPFDVVVPGIYYVAFQVVSPSDSYSIMLRSVKINEYDPMAVSSPTTDGCKVWGGEGCITIDVKRESVVSVCHLDGRVIYNGQIEPTRRHLDVVAGIYIVNVNGVQRKVMVR